MIKREEAMTDLREIAESITSKQWQKLTPKIERIRGYISEQQNKDELLGLYRELIYKEETYITSDSFSQKMEIVERLRKLRLEIEALEEELK